MENETTAHSTAVADMQDQSNMQNVPHQACPLLKLPTELRFEICRLAFQHDLDGITSTPYFCNSASRPLSGAFAILHTCRALRTEGIDAMEPLAQAIKAALQSELDLTELKMAAVDRSSTGVVLGAEGSRYAHLMFALVCLTASTSKIDEVCSVLAGARRADRTRAAG